MRPNDPVGACIVIHDMFYMVDVEFMSNLQGMVADVGLYQGVRWKSGVSKPLQDKSTSTL